MSVEQEFAGVDATGERVLEYLFETRSDLPPPVVAWNLSRRGEDASEEAVAGRLQRFERAELVERVGEGREYYRIDDDGIAYLAGILDGAARRDAR